MPERFLAEFEMYVMLAIARLGDEAYGAAIRREIEETAERPVSIGALYATLHRLEDKGLLRTREADPVPGRRGRPRKYNRLTESGERILRHSTGKLRRMMKGVSLATDGGRE